MLERTNAAHSVRRRAAATLASALGILACDGPQSVLATAGREAERVATLWWWLAGGALLIWLGMVALLLFALKKEAGPGGREPLLILGGGVVLPTVVLTLLLAYSLSMLPDMTARASSASLRIDVAGEMWWWRVRYIGPDGEAVELANEIRMPVGERVGFTLTSPDVIHSFWIPALGGKRDMVPGRVNHLVLEPTRTGTFRGACAEYCGASHAHMNLDVVVMEPDAFEAWLRGQAEDAQAPASPVARRGRDLFIANGCGACHTIRGTPADGRVGPDLTHVGSRATLAAGTLTNDAGSLALWIMDPQAQKPDAYMPAYEMLPEADVRAIAAYLSGLQ